MCVKALVCWFGFGKMFGTVLCLVIVSWLKFWHYTFQRLRKQVVPERVLDSELIFWISLRKHIAQTLRQEETNPCGHDIEMIHICTYQ